MKAVEREGRALMQAIKIHRTASAYFAPLSHTQACVAAQRDGARPPVQTMLQFMRCPAVETQF